EDGAEVIAISLVADGERCVSNWDLLVSEFGFRSLNAIYCVFVLQSSVALLVNAFGSCSALSRCPCGISFWTAVVEDSWLRAENEFASITAGAAPLSESLHFANPFTFVISSCDGVASQQTFLFSSRLSFR
ncbi:unnamed protein product, partial [Phaeothamnion confervicola]